MTFEPRDPQFETRTRENFLSQGYMQTLGTEMSSLAPGHCELTVQFKNALAQQHGFFHGGVVASVADVSGGYAAFSLLAADRTNVTVEFKLSLLSPGQGASLVAIAEVLKSGRTLTVCRSDVFAISDAGARTLCATALATYMAIDRT
jgi:uncharacterized protein (TIGR00369 family)